MNKTLLDEREVSIVTGVQKAYNTGALLALTAPKFIKLGKRVYYRKQDLEQWLAAKPSFTSSTQAKLQGAG